MYNKRKKNNRKKYILIFSIIIIVALAIIININPNRNLTFIEKGIKDSILFVEKTIKAPFYYFKDKREERKEKNKMYEEYQNLKQKIEEIDNIQASYDELEKQFNDLKEQLNIDNTLIEYQHLNATIINRDLNYWNDTITIDKGTHNGVLVDMPVIINKGLIGKVTQTSMFTSTVKLLTASNTTEKISVKIKNGKQYIYGLLVGYNKENQTYLIEGISENTDIKIGSLVTTTGFGDIFPSGILIGKVVGVTTDNFDLAKLVEVKSDINFDDLNYVSVLKRNIQ